MNALLGHSTLDHAITLREWSSTQRQSYWLGYAGLIPFVTLSALYLFIQGAMQQSTGQALVNYGAVIISFLGASHWGAATSGASVNRASRRMLFAVFPALLGWMATLLPLVYGLFVILASLCTVYLIDSRWGAFDAWYLILRRRLTFIAISSIAIVLISMIRSQ